MKMKTSITVKVSESTKLANNPKAYSDYIITLNNAMRKADRLGGLTLGEILTQAKAEIADGAKAWNEYKNVSEFAENKCNISKSRVTQLITGRCIYDSLMNYATYYIIDGDLKKAINETFTVSHFYEMKNLPNEDINTYFANGTFNSEMSVADLKKTIKELSNPDENDGDGNDENNGNGDENENNNDFEIRNADDAESLYKEILKKLEKGETLTIKIATL